MKRKNIFNVAAGISYLLGFSPAVFAGSLSPANYEAKITLGKTISVEKTVTVAPSDVPDIVNTSTTTVNNKYDILFLADNTGSMGNAISNVQTNARSLLQKLSTTYGDIQFGVARYYGDPKEYDFEYGGKKLVQVPKFGTTSNTITRRWKYTSSSVVNGKTVYNYDYTVSGMGTTPTTQKQTYDKNYGSEINYYYQLNSPTIAYQLQDTVNGGTVDSAIAAINTWSAFGGGDLPEANLFALHQAATSGGATSGGVSSGQNTNWRSDAKKIIVWFGDASSHEMTVNKAEAIKALNDNGITVVAINASNTTDSLTTGINTNSQASDIASATKGEFAAVYSSNLTDSMLSMIGDAVKNITTETRTPGKVNLAFTSEGNTSGLKVTYTCTDSRGCNNVSGGESRTFKMDVQGDKVGTYNFKTVVKITDTTNVSGNNKIDVYTPD